jgi:hypothetical protein
MTAIWSFCKALQDLILPLVLVCHPFSIHGSS